MGLVKGTILAITAVVCPPAAGALYLGNVAHKTGKAISDDSNKNTGKHAASVAGAIFGGVVDIDVDTDK